MISSDGRYKRPAHRAAAGHSRGAAPIDDWSRRHVFRDEEMSGLELVRQLELRRIELTRRAGKTPEPLAVRPVAFAIFHAIDRGGEHCYLFEVNKDWGRLNSSGVSRKRSTTPTTRRRCSVRSTRSLG